MELRPILSAMRRNKVGAILIGVQMAITLAILCNALFIIEQRVTLEQASHRRGREQYLRHHQPMGGQSHRPRREIAGRPRGAARDARRGRCDRQQFLSVERWRLDRRASCSLRTKRRPTALTALYLVDEHGLNAMGLKLIAGRNFNADEVTDKAGYTDLNPPPAVIITKALADKAVPGEKRGGPGHLLRVSKDAGAHRRSRRPAAGALDPSRPVGQQIQREFDPRAVPVRGRVYSLHRARAAGPDQASAEGGGEGAHRSRTARG